MSRKTVYEAIDELLEIKDEMRTLADKALRLVRENDKYEYERAKAYWYANIIMALDDDHDYLGRNMSTLQDAIEALEKNDDSETE